MSAWNLQFAVEDASKMPENASYTFVGIFPIRKT
jgi:hypothetical protein